MKKTNIKRKLAAIISADVEGYSRLMQHNEEATIKTLNIFRDAIGAIVHKNRGRVVDSPGDNILMEFNSVVDAVNGAVEIQVDLAKRNIELPDDRKMQFRVGINLGDIATEGGRVYGDGINIAARVEKLAEAGGIAITKAVYDQVKNKLSFTYDDKGTFTVKNIAEPLQIYRVNVDSADADIAIKNPLFLDSNPPIPDKPSVAVLPFDNLTGDESLEYIGDGITDSIISTLSSIGELFVIARHSVFSYKNKRVNIQLVSQELGVRHILDGSVLKAGKRIRITVRLADATTNHQVWTEKFDREIADFFELLDEVAQKVTVLLQSKLTQGEQALRNLGTKNFEAWSFLVKGANQLRHFTKEENTKARELFARAVETDQDYALAWLMLAWANFIDWRHGFSSSPDDSIKKALKFGKKASEMDNQLPEVHSFWNTIYLGRRQFEKAIAEGRKAIKLSPSNAFNYIMLLQTMRYAGEFNEAILLSEKAIRLCPRCPAWYLTLSAPAYIEAGLFDRALSILKTALQRSRNGEISPSLALPHLAVAYIRLGKEDQAKAYAQELIKYHPTFTVEEDFEKLFYKDLQLTENYLNDLRKSGL